MGFLIATECPVSSDTFNPNVCLFFFYCNAAIGLVVLFYYCSLLFYLGFIFGLNFSLFEILYVRETLLRGRNA